MIEDLPPTEVAARLSSPTPPLLIDVREGWEREIAAIAGSLHIPMGDVPQRLDELPEDRDIVVVCHHGARSQQVALWLAGAGYDRVANLDGGIDAWASDVDPSVQRY